MTLRHALYPLALLATAAPPALAQQQGEEFATTVASDDPAFAAAYARARATLPEWLEWFASGSPDHAGFQVKFPLGGYEHIWVDVTERRGDVLVGTLANPPVQEGWARGDRVEVPLSAITDWSYWTRDNVAHGQFTTRVVLARMPRERANKLRRDLGWPEE